MPTGVAMRDVRERLFAAAERVLRRAGPNGLTSRAVTTEADCAKGVLHRHFEDFDAFLAALVHRRVLRLRARESALVDGAGGGAVADTVTDVLIEVFDDLGTGILGLVARDGLRARLRQAGMFGVPLLSDAQIVLAAYLAAERDRGRIDPAAAPDRLGLTLIGTAHLLFAGRDDGPPDRATVRSMTEDVLNGALRR